MQMQIGGGHAREVGDAPRETTSVGVQALPMGDRSAASEDEGEEGRARAMEDVLAARRELQARAVRMQRFSAMLGQGTWMPSWRHATP